MASLLPALALAQALGIVAADRLGIPFAPAWLLAGSLLAVAAVLRAPRWRALLLLGAVVGIGAASLGARLEAARRGPAGRLEATVEATIRSVSWQGDRFRIELADAVSLGPGVPIPTRVRLHGSLAPRFPTAVQEPIPGERWRLRVRLRAPAGTRNPGRPDRARSLSRRGISAEGSLVHPGLAVRVGNAGEGPLGRLRRWRRGTAERLLAAGPGGALLAALGLGERRGLDAGTREAFARLGLAHLLAVSGLHLALAASGAYLLARALLSRAAGFAARRDARRAALAATLPAALGYALASGFAIPVQRALLLLCAAALALASGRARRRAHPLALASLVILAREPYALFEAGFQLSFCATAALLLVASRPGPDAEPDAELDGAARRAAQLAAGILLTSAAALLATTPLVALHFGRVEPAGLAANLLAIPGTAFVLLPAAGLAVLAAGSEGLLPALCLAVPERIAAFSLEAVSAAAGFVRIGFGVGPPPAWALLAAALLGSAALARPRASSLGLALLAQYAALAFAPPSALSPAPPRVVVLDVGQGDATLVQGRTGVLLVDAGPGSPAGFDAGHRAVVPALRALGVRRIDRLAVSHADLDHRGGAPAVIEALPVGAIWLPRHGQGAPGFAALLERARARGIPILERDAAASPERVGDLGVEFLWPPASGPPPAGNDGSLVLRIRAGGRRVLLPGDVGAAAERALLARDAPLGAEVLLLPHHGSRTSSTPGFLAAVSPRHAIASAPCLGRFRMPHPSVRERLRRRGVGLHWTGRDGAIIVGLAPRIRVRSWGAARAGCAAPAPVGRKAPRAPVLPRETR